MKLDEFMNKMQMQLDGFEEAMEEHIGTGGLTNNLESGDWFEQFLAYLEGNF